MRGIIEDKWTFQLIQARFVSKREAMRIPNPYSMTRMEGPAQLLWLDTEPVLVGSDYVVHRIPRER